MDITTEQQGKVVIASLRGRLDAATSRTVEERLQELCSAPDQTLLIDMSELAYISSVGLRVLLTAGKQAKAAGGRIVICAMPPSVAQLFAIAGFNTLFPVYATRADAAKALS